VTRSHRQTRVGLYTASPPLDTRRWPVSTCKRAIHIHKTAFVPAEEPYKPAKETCISTQKALYFCVGLYAALPPLDTRWRPASIFGRAYHFRKRAIYTPKKVIYIHTRALHSRKGAAYTCKRDICIRIRAMYLCEGLWHCTASALNTRRRPMSTHKRALYTRQKNIHFRNRALYVHKRGVCIQKNPYCYVWTLHSTASARRKITTGINEQNSPLSSKHPCIPQRSPVYPQKSHIYPRAICTHLTSHRSTRALCPLCVHKKALHSRQKALYSRQKAQCSAKEPCLIAKEPCTLWKRPVCQQKRYVCKSAQYLYVGLCIAPPPLDARRQPVPLCKRALYIHKRADILPTTHTHARTTTHIYPRACVRTHTHTNMHTQTCTHKHTHKRSWRDSCLSFNTPTHTYRHTHRHTHIGTHRQTHTYTQIL